MQPGQRAYLALVDMVERATNQSQPPTAAKGPKPHWRGVGFSLLGHRFIAAMDEIVELLEVPPYTAIPGTQPWVCGVANVRGRLLPIFDLAVFFRSRAQGPRHLRRVLVVEHGKLYAGLIVDSLHGMQHLPLGNAERAPDNLAKTFAAMVSGQFLIQRQPWLVFDLQALVNNAQFINAAAL